MSQSPAERALLIACDGCHSRKIKCDRTNPCGNCTDSNIKCRRERPTLPRKPRRNITEQVSDQIEDLKERLSVLENTLSQLVQNGITAAQIPSQNHLHPRTESKPRTPSQGSSAKALSIRSLGPSPSDSKYSTPLFSVSEAQIAIENEIQSAPNLSEKRRAVFNAAINSLKHGLDVSEGENKLAWGSLEVSRDALVSPTLPSPEIVHLMLQPRRNMADSTWALDDFMPIISKKTFARMYNKLYDTKDGNYDLPSLLCVSTNACIFTMDPVFAETVDIGLEQTLAKQLKAYFETASAALSHISLLATPSLCNLQAICHGTMIAHEAGDLASAWTLIAAGCNMCLAMDLHLKSNDFTSTEVPHDEVCEAYYCLMFFYVEDKGLSLSLGRNSHFKDSDFEIDILQRPDPQNPPKAYHFCLDLAIIHSGIVNDLQGNPEHRDQYQTEAALEKLLHKMDDIWDAMKDVCLEVNLISTIAASRGQLYLDFSFYSTKATLLTAPGLSHNCRARYKEASLEAARASLHEARKSLEFAKEKHDVDLMKSVVHWTILFFPFTSFFILFCNVARHNCMPDYTLMKDFVAHLSEVRENSLAITKLHNLCQAFCTLAATLLSTPESASKRQPNSEDPREPNQPSGYKRPKRAPADKEESIPPQSTINSLNAEPYLNMPVSNAPTIQPMQSSNSFGYEMPLEPNDVNYESMPYVDNDSSLWQLLDTQPRLQWLETDLSAFDHMWGDPMLYQDGHMY